MHQSLVRGAAQSPGRRTAHMPGYQNLRRAIEQTRDQIAEYRILESRVQQQFDGIVRPLEQSMTSIVTELTHHLIDHHDKTALSQPGRSVLGLWVSDNIEALSEHPFADAEKARLLASRWRESLRAEAAGAMSPGSSRLTSHLSGISGERLDGANHPEQRQASHRTAEKKPDPHTDEAPTENSSEARDDDAWRQARGRHARDTSTVETRKLMAQLFRQLAAALHPDREPDEELKQAKDVLMGQCLKAREQGDLATLVSLHAEHVGGEELLSGPEMTRLTESLERQLRYLQSYLRQMRFGDTLQSMLIERYAGHNDKDMAARFARHASSLQNEIQRLQQLNSSITTTAGLALALEQRRDKLLDRMAINEMTGL